MWPYHAGALATARESARTLQAQRPSRRWAFAAWTAQLPGRRRAGWLAALGAASAALVVGVSPVRALNAAAPAGALWWSVQCAAVGGALGGLAYAALAERLLAVRRWQRWTAGIVVGLALLAGIIVAPVWRFGHVPWAALWCGVPASLLLGLWLVPPQRAVAERADEPGA